jgi:hypothetical protein
MDPRNLVTELKRRNVYKGLLSPTPIVGWLDRKPDFWESGVL